MIFPGDLIRQSNPGQGIEPWNGIFGYCFTKPPNDACTTQDSVGDGFGVGSEINHFKVKAHFGIVLGLKKITTTTLVDDADYNKSPPHTFKKIKNETWALILFHGGYIGWLDVDWCEKI
jgi:hypothetical protein